MTTPRPLQTRRERPRGQQPVPDSSAPNWLLVALPTVVAFGNIRAAAAVVALVVIGAASVATAYRASDRLSLTLASLILPVGGLVIALRPNLPETRVSAIYYVVACGALALVVSKSRSRSGAVLSLLDGLGLLLIAAVAFRYAGIGNAGNNPAIMGNFLTGGERVAFPLLGSLTSGPTLAATYLVAAIPIIARIDRYRVYRVIAAAAALFVLIQGDRRSALFSAILLLALAFFAPRILRRFAPWAIGFFLVGPFIFKLTGALSQQLNLTTFQRTGERNSESLNDRLQIWSRCLDFYQDRVDLYHQTFGFGTSGQVVSGASLTYRRFFAGGPDSAGRSPHNSVIQTMFDGGWIAAAGLVIVIMYLAYVLARQSSATNVASLAMLTTLTFVGSTETLLSPGYTQPVGWMLMALAMIGFAKDSPETGQSITMAVDKRPAAPTPKADAGP